MKSSCRIICLFFALLWSCSSQVPSEDLADRKTMLEVPEHGFHIEALGLSDEVPEPTYWIVTDKQRIQLPELPHKEITTCPGPEFRVSPDGVWILADEKLYHRANEIWLLHRDSDLHYSLVYPSFSREAWKYFGKIRGMNTEDLSVYMTRMGPWPVSGSKIRLTLHSSSGPEDEDPLNMALCYDLKSGEFSVSDDQTTRYY
jgi:hypothetical protein